MADYHRTVILFRSGGLDSEDLQVAQGLQQQLAKRKRYVDLTLPLPADEKWENKNLKWGYEKGVAYVSHPDEKEEGKEEEEGKGKEEEEEKGKELIQLPSVNDFYRDLLSLFAFSSNAPANTISFRRLRLLEVKYEMYKLLNSLYESESTKDDSQDFEGVHKVDNHLHLDASYTASHLAAFIRDKLRNCPDDVVEEADGKKITLREVFEDLKLPVERITIDSLGSQNGEKLFHRFDHFNASYNPFGFSRLRDIFMSPANYMKGKYFAEIIQQVFDRTAELTPSVSMEPRLTLFGMDPNEWNTLADWVVDHNLLRPSVRWMVQIPRIYPMFKAKGVVDNFHTFNANVFTPLFEVTLNPESNPKLHHFLQHVVAFDSVDDESRPDELGYIPGSSIPNPQQWESNTQPPYSYYLYYLWANLQVLNHLRMKKGMNSFQLRPHCGESGPNHHLCTGFLLANGINHGIQLDSLPALQYLYYLAQVGITMSPLSNNVLFRALDRNPFGKLFFRGLHVTLGTDDPLQFHSTKEPLIEEYTIAKQFWKLTVTDLSEIARNSVLQSGYSDAEKKGMLGEHFLLPGAAGNNICRTNLPNCRVQFRHENQLAECQYILRCLTTRVDGSETLEAHSSDDPSVYINEELAVDWNTIALWHPVEGKDSHVVYWRAKQDYNLPSPLTGSVPSPTHLSFKKGDYLTLVSRLRSTVPEKPDEVLCVGLDQSGQKGFFPVVFGEFLVDKETINKLADKAKATTDKDNKDKKDNKDRDNKEKDRKDNKDKDKKGTPKKNASTHPSHHEQDHSKADRHSEKKRKKQ